MGQKASSSGFLPAQNGQDCAVSGSFRPNAGHSVIVVCTCSRKEAGSPGRCSAEPIGTLVRRARRKRGLSQYDLADTLIELSHNDGLSRAEVARWERGKRVPGPYWRGWLSSALDLPTDQLRVAARATRACRMAAYRPISTHITRAGKELHG